MNNNTMRINSRVILFAVDRSAFRLHRFKALLRQRGLWSEGKRSNNIEIAKITGLHKGSISRIINGNEPLNKLETIERIADGFNIPLSYFFTDDELCPSEYNPARIILVNYDLTDQIKEALVKAAYVLKYGGRDAVSLRFNTESFYDAVREREERAKTEKELMNEIKALKGDVSDLKQRTNSTPKQPAASTLPRLKPE